MKKIILVRSNPVNPDVRVEKEAEALGKNGYQVSVLGWDRKKSNIQTEVRKHYTISRIQLRAPIGKAVVLIWPIWWLIEFIWLLSHSWDIVHVADFDCYPPALCVAKIKRKKIIYDIYDFYPDMVSLPRPIHNIFSKIDRTLMKHADAIIIADICRLKQIGADSDKGVTVIYNSPPGDGVDISEINQKNEEIRIFYGGGLMPDRDVVSMIKVVANIPDISLVIAGSGHKSEVEKVKCECNKTQNSNYIGLISPKETITETIKSDVLYALYDPAIPNNRLASPNKLFEAMMCGKPIIVNEGVATADKVREENCGLVVPYGDYEALKEAVLTLKNNPELRKELGENGRRAYETKYNWKIMEKRLLDLYASLEEKQ